jgi:hypothetical protein
MSSAAFVLRFTILLGAALGSPGCIALPVLLPPARISMGGGVAAGQVVPVQQQSATNTPSSEATSLSTGTTGLMSLRIDIRPLQLVPELHSRTHDFAIGYVVDQLDPNGSRPLSASGGYFRYDYSPVLLDHNTGSETGQFRINTGLTADVLQRSDTSTMGGGFSAVAGIEFLGWSRGDFSQSDSQGGIVGSNIGQFGVGFEVETKARFLPGMNYLATTASLTLRTPGIIALIYAWLPRK